MGAQLVAAPIKPPEIDWSSPGDWQTKEKDYIDTLATLAREQHSGDLVGEVVRWQRADGYASYMVLSEKPLTLVHLNLGDGYQVEDALLRGLTLAEVQRMVNWERSWREAGQGTNEKFYGSLKPGDIVHYHEGSAAFVRCEVVAAEYTNNRFQGKTIAGMALKPIALVGEVGRRRLDDGRWVHGWAEYDMPRYDVRGEVRMGYHVEKVIEGELMQPHASNIYEYEGYDRSRDAIDPRELEPLSLEPPPMTEQQQRIAPLAIALEKIRTTVAEYPPEISGEDGYLHILTEVMDIVLEARTGREITSK